MEKTSRLYLLEEDEAWKPIKKLVEEGGADVTVQAQASTALWLTFGQSLCVCLCLQAFRPWARYIPGRDTVLSGWPGAWGATKTLMDGGGV